MPLDQPHVIDVVAADEKTGQTALIMYETRAWTGSREQLFQLQEKVNAYLSFALDGEMAESYPDLANRPLRVQLECVSPPDEATLNLLTLIHDQVALQEIDFQVHVTGPGGGEHHCECGSAG